MGDPIPPPRPAHTFAAVDAMFASGVFRTPRPPFWNGFAIGDVVPGTHVLWKSVLPIGRKGEQSTRLEYFSATCDGWVDDEHVMLK